MTTPTRFTVYFDGCCEPKNPGGHAGFGCVIFDRGQRVHEHSGFIPASPETSNNVAEYLALIAALSWLWDNGHHGEVIEVYGDSMLVIRQMWADHRGKRWKIKAGFYVEYALEAQEMLAKFARCRGSWIPREKNAVADDLSKAELRARNVTFAIQPEGAQ